MDSKKPNPFGELLKKLVFEDLAEEQLENETEEILPSGTEADFAFGDEDEQTENEPAATEDTAKEDGGSSETENTESSEDVPDFLKTFENEAKALEKLIAESEADDEASEEVVREYKGETEEPVISEDETGETEEPVISEDETEDTKEPVISEDETGETEEPVISEDENTDSEDDSDADDETEKSEDDSEDSEKAKPILFSGPVSDDAPPASLRDPDDDIFKTKRQSFSYRSTAKTENRTGTVIKNPEDNIRYVRKESRKLKEKNSDADYEPKKKHLSDQGETKADIAPLETGKEKSKLSESTEKFTGLFSKLKTELFGSRNVSERNQNIDVKSVPEVDYFSIDIDINETPETDENEKKPGFFRRINKSFERSAENSLDDYNKPSDASLILEDLYSLKNNLTIKFAIQMVAVLLSVYLSASALYKIPAPSFISNTISPHRYSFAMFMVSALAMFSAFPMVTSGLKNLFKKKADCDSLAALTITISTIAAAISTESPELIKSGDVCLFAPVAITAFLANTIGKHLIVNRAINNFDMLISSHDHDNYSLFYVDNEAKAEQITKGVINDYPILAATRKTEFSTNFLRYSYSSDIADKLCRKFVPSILFISVLLTLVSVVACSKNIQTLNVTFITSMFSMFVSLCACFGVPLIVNMPLAAAASEAEDNESMILGYQSIDDFYDTNAIILGTEQLFPDDSLKLSSIKMFSDTKIDDAIIYAASMIIKSESIFTGMFDNIINHDKSLLEKVENFSHEDTLGICGWIKNKRVLLGTRKLMADHNIEGIPPKSKDQDEIMSGRIPLYLSVSGNLAAVFTVRLTADKKVSEYLSELIENNISLVIKNNDCAVTAPRIARLFGLPGEMVKIIPAAHREFCDRITAPAENSGASVICSGTLSSITKALSNIKLIHHSSLTGIVLQSTSAILALVFAIVFMFIGVIGQITPLLLILYHTVWAFLTLFIMKVKPK